MKRRTDHHFPTQMHQQDDLCVGAHLWSFLKCVAETMGVFPLDKLPRPMQGSELLTSYICEGWGGGRTRSVLMAIKGPELQARLCRSLAT